ncbi:MAG TPA: hypothetical protein VM889_09805 [Candidatus Thermoplasmatota archaeon]|nr:hypothetical protein [Candidatus Thermoplasmatota archaeon]
MVLNGLQFIAGILFFLFLFRVLYILGSNPVGEVTPELIYLRGRELRTPAYLILAYFILAAIDLLLPFMKARGVLPASLNDLPLALAALEALTLFLSAALVYLVVARYTQRGLDRRIRDSLETLAFLAGQARRKRRPAAPGSEAIAGGRAEGRRANGDDEPRRRRREA